MSDTRAPTEDKTKEEILKKYRKGIGPTALSKEYGINVNTIKSWAKRDQEGKPKKAKKVATDKPKKVATKSTKKVATSQPKKGGQIGNKNAVGNKGGDFEQGNLKSKKHGAYTDPHKRELDPDEIDMDVSANEETLILEQIKLYTIRENRILHAINEYRRSESSTALYEETTGEDKRAFKDEEEQNEYESRRQEKIDAGERMPGTPYQKQTVMENKDNIIARLERELSTVMRSKDAAIKTLLDIRERKTRLLMDQELHPYEVELADARVEQMDAQTQRLLGENIDMEDVSAAEDMIYGSGGKKDEGETPSTSDSET